MASNIDHPELWRLHSNNGIVPLKYLGIEGEFTAESATVTMKTLVHTDYLVAFMNETFPPPERVGNLLVPKSNPLPGLNALVATKASFRTFDDQKPSDPFHFDPSAPEGTYNELIEVTVEYGRNKLQAPTTDPITFLEISCQAKGEYIAMLAAGGASKIQGETNTQQAKIEAKIAPGGNNAPLPVNTRIPAEKAPLRTGDPEYKVTVPLTEWTVKWPSIPFEYFRDVLIYRLRWALGRINSDVLPFLFYAEPETVLLEGYNMTQQFTWKDGGIDKPPCNVEMKFTEKRVVWKGLICGHNHLWVPGTGWKYYLLNGTDPLYESIEMGGMFNI